MASIQKGKIVTITSMKGGVGKSTTTILLASVLSNLKKKVLILDLDLYSGDIAFMINAKVRSNIYTLCDDIRNNRCKLTDLENYIYKYNDYISLLAANKDPRQANKISKSSIETLLNNLTYNYDAILIDTNHVLDVINMLALDYSDTIIDVFTNDAVDVKNTKTFISLCNNVNVKSLLLVQNDAQNDRKEYLPSYSLKNILQKEIDYIIDKSLYLPDFDRIIVEKDILKYFSSSKAKAIKEVEKLALRLLEEKGANEDEEK